MNLLLLSTEEIGADSVATLRGRRAAHAHSVLRVEPGQDLRIGLVDGPLGTGRVIVSEPDRLAIRCAFASEVPDKPQDVLVLAIPRPKALLRCLEDAAALGFGRIVLIRTWRVDKSFLQSHSLDAKSWREALLLGLEQSRRTHVPRVLVFPLFRPFVEDELEAAVTPTNRFVAHLADARPVAAAALAPAQPLTLAIGPEGGFVPFEVEQLRARGFAAITAGEHPQRVPVALCVLRGQLQLLRSMRGPA